MVKLVKEMELIKKSFEIFFSNLTNKETLFLLQHHLLVDYVKLHKKARK